MNFDLHIVRQEVEAAKERASHYGSYVDMSGSPREIKRQLADREACAELWRILDMLLAGLSIRLDGYPEWELALVMERIRESAEVLERIRASDYAAFVHLKFPPFVECQVYRWSSERSGVTHSATGKERAGGSGSSTESCCGPLRTEDEIRLGMCGSCLKKYGPGLGRSILRPEDIAAASTE